MQIGAMNFPGRSVKKELHRIAEDGFDFVDLTIEPPAAWDVDGKEIGSLISDLGLSAVGHTAWYLPIASSFPALQAAARDMYRHALDVFADAGVELVNVHPDQRIPMHSMDQVRKRNADAIGDLVDDAAGRGITIMVENLDRNFSGVIDLQPIFERVPEARFHLDIGHANLNLGLQEPNRTADLLKAFGDRLAHVHVSDNRGGAADLHLPLGAGSIDWKTHVRLLKEHGYDGTVTLEVFTRDRDYLLGSRQTWQRWWIDV